MSSKWANATRHLLDIDLHAKYDLGPYARPSLFKGVLENTLSEFGEQEARRLYNQLGLDPEECRINEAWTVGYPPMTTIHASDRDLSKFDSLDHLFSTPPVYSLWWSQKSHGILSEVGTAQIDDRFTVIIDEPNYVDVIPESQYRGRRSLLRVEPGNGILVSVVEQFIVEPELGRYVQWLERQEPWKEIVNNKPFGSRRSLFSEESGIRIIKNIQLELTVLGLPCDEATAFYTWQRMCPWWTKEELGDFQRRIVVRSFVVLYPATKKYRMIHQVGVSSRDTWPRFGEQIETTFIQHRTALERWQKIDCTVDYTALNRNRRPHKHFDSKDQEYIAMHCEDPVMLSRQELELIIFKRRAERDAVTCLGDCLKSDIRSALTKAIYNRRPKNSRKK